MSESSLTRRTRRKLGAGVETIHKQVRSKVKAEPSASSRASVDIAGAHLVAPPQSQQIQSDDSGRIEPTITSASSHKPAMASETHTMPAKTKNSPPHITTTASDNGSSSLSDLDEIPEDHQEEDTKSSFDGESIKDNDTEAETERIDPSPRKSRQLAAEATDNTAARNQTKGPTVESSSPVIIPKDQGHTNGRSIVNDNTMSGDFVENGVGSPRKRKRSSPLSEPDEEATQDGKPARKRSASAKLVDLSRSRENSVGDNDSDVAVEEAQIPDNAFDRSPTEELNDGLIDDAEPESVADVDEQMELAIDQDPESARSSVEAEDGQKTPDAMDEGPPVGGTDIDEAEMAAKTEEELAKKRVAMEDLKPIEIRFAIFRDKIFDEKNNELTKIEEDLRLAEPTNLLYLRQIQAVHARCEEKIQHEDCMLRYKSEALQRVTLAERAIAHSQYAQEVREARDRHLIELNKTFCRIQRERRQWKAVEPHYTRSFNPNRAEQIANQRSYNKEVSLLSGIARHAGFPAAPELEGATSGDVESDLRKMNIRPNAQPYVAQLASSSHQQEMAGEANFLERNTWARNPPSSVPRTLYRDQSNASPFEPGTRAPQGDIHMLERAMTESGPEVVPHTHQTQQRSRESPFSSGNLRAFQPSPGQELPPRDPATLAVDSPISAPRRPSPLGKPERMNKKMLGSSPMSMTDSTPPNKSPQLTQSMRNADSRQHQQRRDRETYFAGFRPSSTMDPMQRSGRFSLPPAQPQDRRLFGPIQNGITTEPTGQR